MTSTITAQRPVGAKGKLNQLSDELMIPMVKTSFSGIIIDSTDFDNLLLMTADEVVQRFEPFYMTLASQRGKLVKVQMLGLLKHVLHGDSEKLMKLAALLATTQQTAYAKVRSVASGCKLAGAMQRLVTQYKSLPELSPEISLSAQSCTSIEDAVESPTQKLLKDTKALWDLQSPISKPAGEIALQSPLSIKSSPGDKAWVFSALVSNSCSIKKTSYEYMDLDTRGHVHSAALRF